ncbi:glycosyltransferase family 2 protein [Halonotius aquaticus]|uniref:Glycosyltransferase family 2 protein n=1 Tax=Halonotius aquaticus TaxID=2216978 RepID=A0A3A6PKR2_9EURY|nr:glycosyltransferase family A protein [Halonotius aquaticus]RJX42029.1 glycosyltransferase family 2 protein [Halonotius aquaticus]
MTNPIYSIAVCNFNMADTLEPSLRSMVNQIPEDDYEVVVVDGGSTDGSRDILRSLEAEYPNLRAILDRADECNHLGGDRNISFEEARGEYVLESMDTDDCYFEGIVRDFVSIYHQIESVVDYPYFLSGTGINMAPRKLLLDVPYYDLGGAEDRDLYRRLFVRDTPLWIDHGPISEEIGYHMNWRDELRRDIHGKICDFQSGITLASALRWSLSHERHWILERNRGFILNTLKKPYDLFTHCYAYWKANGREHHDAPPSFERKGTLEQKIAEVKKTLPDLESAYGFEVDRESFSEAGYEAFVEYAEP